MLVLHQFEVSPFCEKVRRILHWKGVPYEGRDVPLVKALGVRRRNPAGKLPFIEHEGRLIADSTEIAYYLEERFPDPPLLPEDPAQRALCHFFEDWADESLYFYEMRLRFTLPHNARRWVPALVHADPPFMKILAPYIVPRMMKSLTRRQGVGRKTVEQVLKDVERHVQSLSAWLGDRSWLVGDALSLADIGVFAELACIRGTEEGGRVVDVAPNVSAWLKRVDHATGPFVQPVG